MRPRRAAVGRLVDAVTDREIGPLQALAAAGVETLRIARRDGERADRSGWFIIEDRHPRASRVVASPNAAVDRGDIEEIRLICDAVDRDGASSAHRPDESPMHGLIE